MRRFAIGTVVFLCGVLACLLWIALRAKPRHPRASRGGDEGVVAPEVEARVPLPPPSVVAHAPDPTPRTLPDGTLVDRAHRDAVRRELLAAHPAPPEPSTPETTAAAAPAPPDEALEVPGHLDAKYIQDRIHEDYFPLAKDCYLGALKKAPDLRGKLVMKFSIVGDQKIGGIIDSASFDDGTTIDDPEFRTCMRESLLSVSFKAPDEGGKVDVVYPIAFSPGDDSDEDASTTGDAH